MIARITREQLRDWGACYDDDEIAALVPPEGVTPLEVLDAPIPAADRLWVLLREEIVPASALRMLAVTWARAALLAERSAGREPDERSWAACDVSERHARGEATDAELAAAWRAAWDAARDAAWRAARAGDRAAAWAAAGAAVCAAPAPAPAATGAAAWDAARAAAGAAGAARDAARDAAWRAKLADVRRVLTIVEREWQDEFDRTEARLTALANQSPARETDALAESGAESGADPQQTGEE